MARAPAKVEKAKKTTQKRGVEALPSRALEHGEKAFGAKYLRPGFALTPELDLAFALGHGSPMGPVRLLADLPLGAKRPTSHTQIHRNVAIAELRVVPATFGAVIPHEAAPAPIAEDEAQAIVRKRLEALDLQPIHYRALEAMVGPSCVLPAYVDGLEAIPTAAWGTGRLHGLFPLLHGLLLRTPPKESAEGRARLELLFKERQKTFAAANLDIMLHGREGIARVGYKYSLTYKAYGRSDKDEPSNVLDLCFCDGEPEFVSSQFEALWTAFKFKVQPQMNGPSPARLFFIGGDKALETELRVVGQYPGTKQPEALESYADLRSPLAARLVLRLTGEKSKVKAAATEWLRARDWAQPLLSEWAGDRTSPDAALAKAALT
ncbi:MAG: hypothetical protein Q8N26_18910 [Myxococcales bacterium]|nr:hypothetical protein [Myxococcales bacterium]